MEDSRLIYKQISLVMSDIGSVSKDRKNEQQKYSFRGIEDLYLAAHPAMIKHGVFCAPEVLERDEYRFEKTNYEGKASTWLHVTMKVRHRFFAEDGSFVDVVTYGEGLDNSDKAGNKAMSGAMKYALIELFCVPTKDVDDSDRDTPEQGTKKKVVIQRPVKVPDAGFTNLIKDGTVVVPDPIQLGPPPPETNDEFDEYIDSVQAGKIAKRFRESLREELRPMSEALRHDALRIFKKIDKDGNPSSLMIRRDEYATIGKKMIEHARSL